MHGTRMLEFEPELRISARPILVAFIGLGVALVLLGDSVSDLMLARNLLHLALACYGSAAVAWVLDLRHPQLGRWSTVVALVVLSRLAIKGIGLPGCLALAVIPSALAAPLVGIPATIATAALQSAILILPASGTAVLDLPSICATLVAIWSMPIVMYVAYRPVYQLAHWSWSYLQQARAWLQEARDHQAELGRALNDLAHANRQLTLMNENLAGMRLIAEQAQKTKTAFLSKVSHEFRTPLNMIIGLTDLLIETPEIYGESLSPKLLEHLGIVHRNCEHLASMIDDVLDLSQIEAGRLALRRERVDLTQVIDRALTVVQPLVEKKQLHLERETPRDLPLVLCDRTRISQVIVNLLSNAARFTEQGEISVRVTQENEHIVVSVADTGPGIPEEDAVTIFEPFCQSTSRPWQDKGGSGLGLSISKQFVELHGGRIWVTSQVGIGSTFSFSLPLVPLVRPVGRPGHWILEDWEDRGPREGLPTSRLEDRVIVCDAMEGVHPLFARFSSGIEYVHTANLEQTVRELQECPAQAVVLNTPSPDDLWCLVDRARREITDTPIIGCCMPPRTERATTAGAKGYLIKPVTRGKLMGAIAVAGEPARRVLVVDDRADDRELFRALLQARDPSLEVMTASCGEEALDKLRDHNPDVMLLDILMPHMDGWKVLALKSQDRAIKDIPVVLVSAEDPNQRPTMSPMILATMAEGLSVTKLLSCSAQLAALLRKPD